MPSAKTHFEQVSLETVAKIVDDQIKKRETAEQTRPKTDQGARGTVKTSESQETATGVENGPEVGDVLSLPCGS